MLNNKVKIVLAATGISIIALTGVSQASFIQPAIQNPVAILQQQTQAIKADVGDGDGEKNDDTQEQQDSAKLQSLAKITPLAARTAAEAKQGGKASSVKLEDENGKVVYSVMIGKTEVTVDAADGRILSTENN